MASYSVADAKNSLPRLIDKALEGEEVVITRHGKPVVELKPASKPAVSREEAIAAFARLTARRKARKPLGITSVELLNQLYEEDDPLR